MNRRNVYFVTVHFDVLAEVDVYFYETLESALKRADYFESMGYQVTVEIDCGF